MGAPAQGSCVFLLLTFQFDYLWVLLYKASLADVHFYFFPTNLSRGWAYAVQDGFCIPQGNLPGTCSASIGYPLLLLRLTQGA